MVIEDDLELRPENGGRLRALIEAGRVAIGPWWVQPDEFLPSGESRIRSLQTGIRARAQLRAPACGLGDQRTPAGDLRSGPGRSRAYASAGADWQPAIGNRQCLAVPSFEGVRAYPGRALGLLYPHRCAGCGRFGAVLCERCRAAMEPATGTGRCANCGARWAASDHCPRCVGWRFLDRALAAYEMSGPARQVVHALKYGRVRDYVPLMAEAMAPLRELASFEAAVAVPLHASRMRDRGFNQAELLLGELAWPTVPGRLRRVRKTATQVGKDVHERRRNVDAAFAYEGGALAGLAIALVDDVVTTGATMDECARVLREAGAGRVIALSFARASFQPGTRPVRD